MAMARKCQDSKIERRRQLKTYILDRLAIELTPEQILVGSRHSAPSQD
ncbi:MAG: hypothetical protein JKY17_06375 [Magnetovibrio sp.]|nr:hypothetical protein [Magnetovibrio sp.]